ncbi:MAG: 50S ribosomal protein L22 [Candidatus Eisenbacteria bacterium]|nr:50S ribosomal protein L22 [Candidatus Eisenbacteria bacterium]
MEARARARFIRIPPRKVRQVVDLIRGRDVEESMQTLHFLKRAARIPVEKTLRSAVANVFNTKEGAGLAPSDLYVSEAFVDEGPALKRFTPAPMGRATPIRKRTAHITIVVSQKGGAKAKAGAKAKRGAAPKGGRTKPAGRKPAAKAATKK